MTSAEIFKKDIFRYYGREKETAKEKLLRPMELRYIKAFRLCSSKNKLRSLYNRMKLRRLSKKL